MSFFYEHVFCNDAYLYKKETYLSNIVIFILIEQNKSYVIR